MENTSPPNNYAQSITNNDRLIVSIPLGYTYFTKPVSTAFEALNSADWRTRQTENALISTTLAQVSATPSIGSQIVRLIPENSAIFDNLPQLRAAVARMNQEYSNYDIITILNEFRVSDFKLTVSIIGSCDVRRQIHDIRLEIMRSFNPVMEAVVILDASSSTCFCFDDNRQLKSEFCDLLKQIASFTGSSIYVTESAEDSLRFDLHIVGHRDQVTDAENKVRLGLDDLNPQLYSDYFELDSLSLLPLIAGPTLANLKRIIREADCTMYLPNVLPELYYEEGKKYTALDEKPRIYLTGLRSLVLQAKNSILQVVRKISKTPFMKQLSVVPLKREVLIMGRCKSLMLMKKAAVTAEQQQHVSVNYMLNNHQAMEDIVSNADSHDLLSFPLENIMYSTGCYIAVPPFGYESGSETGDIVTFQGNSMESVENAVRQFVLLLSSLYSSQVEFGCLQTAAYQGVNINKFLNFCDTLASNADVAVSSIRFGSSYVVQMLGSPENTRIGTNYLSQLESYLNENVERINVQFQLELPNQERDFIAGKKNGKLVKISNSASVTVQLLPFTDHNFIVELSGETLEGSVYGLELLEQELPKSLMFNIPESFHRQIIGVGGQTVQTIMRKFNVFIKFSNSFEMGDRPLDHNHVGQAANFGQEFVRKKNVLIKCPAKNRMQITPARVELSRLVEKVITGSYVSSDIRFSGAQWRLLTSESFNDMFNRGKKRPTNFVMEVEKHTNTYIRFPGPDTPYTAQPVEITVYGSEANHRSACLELQKLLPYCYRLCVKKTANFDDFKAVAENVSTFLQNPSSLRVSQLSFLDNVVVPVRIMYNVELQLTESADVANTGSATDGSCFVNIYFYPSSFGCPFNTMKTERLSKDRLNHVIRNDLFQQMLNTVKDALGKFNMDVNSECVHAEALDANTTEGINRIESDPACRPISVIKPNNSRGGGKGKRGNGFGKAGSRNLLFRRDNIHQFDSPGNKMPGSALSNIANAGYMGFLNQDVDPSSLVGAQAAMYQGQANQLYKAPPQYGYQGDQEAQEHIQIENRNPQLDPSFATLNQNSNSRRMPGNPRSDAPIMRDLNYEYTGYPNQKKW